MRSVELRVCSCHARPVLFLLFDWTNNTCSFIGLLFANLCWWLSEPVWKLQLHWGLSHWQAYRRFKTHFVWTFTNNVSNCSVYKFSQIYAYVNKLFFEFWWWFWLVSLTVKSISNKLGICHSRRILNYTHSFRKYKYCYGRFCKLEKKNMH